MAAGDPYWNNVVLALHMDGANASTVFTDLKGRTVTAVGNAQISTTQSKFGGASALFDGTGDYLTTPASTDFAFGTGEFTVEAWVNFSNVAVARMIVDGRNTTQIAGFALYMSAASKLVFYNTAAERIIGATSFTVSTWQHVAVCRASGVTRLFLDGVKQGSDYADATNYTDTLATIGADRAGGSLFMQGYIDDLRITKGVARYTANFTPPAAAFPNGPAMISGTVKDSTGAFAPRAVRVYRKSDGALSGATVSHATTGAFAVPALDATPHYAISHDSDADPYWSNVVLATHFDTDSVIDPYMSSVVLGLHMEGANASTVFQDVTGKTVTPTATTISTAQSKFGASSALFNGTTSVLSVPTDTGFNFTGDFTIEGWCYWSALPAASNSTIFAAKYTSVADQRSWLLRLYNTAGVYNLQMLLTPNGVYAGTELIASSSLTVTAGSWHHVVCTRSAGVVRLFFNGVIVGSATSAISTYAGSAPLRIGHTTDFTYFDGYIDDLRITKGVARYTANFTPPTVPFSSFKDLTGKDLMVSGVPSINTGAKKYGDAALLLSGTGQYLSQSSALLAADAFTCEAWVSTNAVGAAQTVFSQHLSAAGRLGVQLSAGGSFLFFVNGLTEGNLTIADATTVSTGVFHHVAVVREPSGLFRFFVDGVEKGTGLRTGAIESTPLLIGILNAAGTLTNAWNGRIDDLRITKGVARYLSDFTPPERAFPGAVGAGTANAQIFDDLIPI